MNQLRRDIAPYFSKLAEALGLGKPPAQGITLFLAPQALHLEILAQELRKLPHWGPANGGWELAAQNGGTAARGAFTGECSPEALREIGCTAIFIGHSERRHLFNESNSLLLERTKAALAAQCKVIYCVGEQISDRKTGNTFRILEQQLDGLKSLAPALVETQLVLAYEPVWAIGTGEVATPLQANEAHCFLRSWLRTQWGSAVSEKMSLLYGGSVQSQNAAQLIAQPHIDGFLVGGASLDPLHFAAIIRICAEAH